MFSAGGRWKTTICLIRKKKRKTLHVQYTFFVHFFAVVLHDYNVKFYGGMSYVFSFYIFFSLPLIFSLHWCPLAFLFFVTAASKLSLFFQQKNVSFVVYLSL